jgi:ABC-2 type transport system ATP-binding protein
MNNAVIQTADLTKTYGRDRGIDKVNLRVDEGEIFGFIGPNGAGKSTTIRVLLNLLFPTGGSAQIMGYDIVRDSKKIRARTGYVPAEANPYPHMTTDDFLHYCASYYHVPNGDQRINDLMELFEVERKRRISDLSTGNRKKLSIIQSLIHRPALLIIDEPTTGLDPLMQARLFKVLKEENNRGMTVFFSSHTLSDVQMLCRRVAIIREGSIINVEEIEALRKKQLKKVHIESYDIIDDTITGLKGIESSVIISDRALEFMYSGDINMLISALKVRNIADLTIEEPSLEEIFMHYYN